MAIQIFVFDFLFFFRWWLKNIAFHRANTQGPKAKAGMLLDKRELLNKVLLSLQMQRQRLRWLSMDGNENDNERNNDVETERPSEQSHAKAFWISSTCENVCLVDKWKEDNKDKKNTFFQIAVALFLIIY